MIRLLIGALALALVLGGRRRYNDEDQDEPRQTHYAAHDPENGPAHSP